MSDSLNGNDVFVCGCCLCAVVLVVSVSLYGCVQGGEMGVIVDLY